MGASTQHRPLLIQTFVECENHLAIKEIRSIPIINILLAIKLKMFQNGRAGHQECQWRGIGGTPTSE